MDNNEYYFAPTTPIGGKKKIVKEIKDKRKEFYTIWQQVKK